MLVNKFYRKTLINKNNKKKAHFCKKTCKDNIKNSNDILRVVIRQLPPMMSMEELIKVISPQPEYTEFYIGRGRPEYKQFNFSRAYLTFTNFEDVLLFKDRFDGYVFVDDKGHEYRAIVEYSPFQKTSHLDNARTHTDPKLNTIHNDREYIEFMNMLNQSTEKLSSSSSDAILEEIQNRNRSYKAPQVTPLIQFLLKRREDDRRKIDDKKQDKTEDKNTGKTVDKKNNKMKHTKKIFENSVSVLKSDKKEARVLKKKIEYQKIPKRNF